MIEGYVTGDAEVARRFDTMSDRLRAELRASVGRLSIKLQRQVSQEKLSGQVLKVRTGRLRRSIAQAVTEEGSRVVGVVSTNVSYAPAHEYGFTGSVSVSAHLRMIMQAWGKPIAPREVQVKSFTRPMKLPERSFLRSALRELANSGAIETEFDNAVQRSIA